jgi:hypothetical protein
MISKPAIKLRHITTAHKYDTPFLTTYTDQFQVKELINSLSNSKLFLSSLPKTLLTGLLNLPDLTIELNRQYIKEPNRGGQLIQGMFFLIDRHLKMEHFLDL